MRLVKPAASASLREAEARLDTLTRTATPGDVPGSHAPLVFNHFRLLDDALSVEGVPTLDDYQRAGHFITHSQHGSQFWLADWLNYGASRADWGERLQQAQDLRRYAPSSIEEFKRVARKVPAARRRAELTYEHHRAVESLQPDEQTEILEKAVERKLSANETRQEARALSRRSVLKTQAKLEGRYRVIYVRPPWATMSAKDMGKLPVPAHALPHAVLFMWCPASRLLQNPGPRDVLESWDFEYQTNIVFDQVLPGGGEFIRMRHSHLLIATRGKCLPDVVTDLADSVVTIRTPFDQPGKPEAFRKFIETHWTTGAKLELFADRQAEGWTSFGADHTRWGQPALDL